MVLNEVSVTDICEMPWSTRLDVSVNFDINAICLLS